MTGSMDSAQPVVAPDPFRRAPLQPEYACDGRVFCPQMTSGEEAKYFLAHGPGVKMDGDNDGSPVNDSSAGVSGNLTMAAGPNPLGPRV